MRFACTASTISVSILRRRGAALPLHAFSDPGPHPGLPVAFSIPFVLQIYLWHLGISQTTSAAGADSVSDRGFYGDLMPIASPLRRQVFTVSGCPSEIATSPLSLCLP